LVLLHHRCRTETKIMKQLTKLIIALACLACVQSCNDDDFTSSITPNPEPSAEELRDQQFQNENFGSTTTGKFIGIITDETGGKLENVLITIGNAVTMTDRNGVFVLNDVEVFENFAYIKAQKDGYINGSRVVIPKTTGANIIHITLLEKEVTQTISTGIPSEVTSDNVKVNFSGDFITADGSPYTGAVEVVLDYVAPNRQETFTEAPGSLFAQTASNEARSLETYGMVAVNLFSPTGESLNINPESPATITFPIDFSQTDTAPETIALWYFDEEQGYWKEEGEATKDGNTYVAEVTHFTWWNCDIPFDSVALCVTLTPLNATQPAPYFMSMERVSTGEIIYYGPLLSYEADCGLVPRNEEIAVAIYGGVDSQACNANLIHEEIIGGYATDATATISFQEDFTITPITGMVTNCDGAPMTNGYLYVNTVNIFNITNGTIDVGVQTCTNITETLAIQLYDLDSGQWTIVDNITMDGNPVNIGSLSTCEDTGGIFNGDLTFTTQSELASFSALNFSAINGNLNIGIMEMSSTISDLTPLLSLQNVTGRLIILNNPMLANLNGLENIIETGSTVIASNNALTSLDGLNGLTNTGFLSIINNTQLASINAVSNLVSLSTLRIEDNPLLTSLQGLENITSLHSITLENNDLIPNLLPLGNLTELKDLYVNDNPSITSLEGLEQITEIRHLWIYGNANLTSLNGLENVVSILSSIFPSIAIGGMPTDVAGAVVPDPNPGLTDLCGLQNLFANGNGLSVEVYIENNAFNPTPQDIIDGNCSQ